VFIADAGAGTASLIIAIGLASIVFLCTAFIVAALMIRSRWDDIARRRDGKSSH